MFPHLRCEQDYTGKDGNVNKSQDQIKDYKPDIVAEYELLSIVSSWSDVLSQ